MGRQPLRTAYDGTMPDGDDGIQRDGLPLSLDPAARSSDEGTPAFLARPEGAPAYHGFTVLEGVEVEGFRLGTISALGPDHGGDAFIIAPDGSRAGLVWEVGESRAVREVSAFDAERWGVWAVEFARPMGSRDDAQRNLDHILPALRPKWEAWKAARLGPGASGDEAR